MGNLVEWLANLIIIIGLVFIGFGVFGVFRFKEYFSRALVAAKVDTVGFITILFGLIIKNGLSFFSGKIFLVLVLYVITNPIATHTVARSAHLSGYRIKKEK